MDLAESAQQLGKHNLLSLHVRVLNRPNRIEKAKEISLLTQVTNRAVANVKRLRNWNDRRLGQAAASN
jgi:hypothetical protein